MSAILDAVTHAGPALDYLQNVDVPSGSEGAQKFLGTPAGKILVVLSSIIGLLVIVYGAVKAIPNFGQQKYGKGIGLILMFGLLGGILLNLNFSLELAQMMGDFAKQLVGSADEVTEG